MFINHHFLADIDSPKNLVTDQVTETTATVSWDPVQAAIDRYLVRYTSADGDSREVPVGQEQSSVELTGLRPGVEYTVRVWAERGSRQSGQAEAEALTGNELARSPRHCVARKRRVCPAWFSSSGLGERGRNGRPVPSRGKPCVPCHRAAASLRAGARRVASRLWSSKVDGIAQSPCPPPVHLLCRRHAGCSASVSSERGEGTRDPRAERPGRGAAIRKPPPSPSCCSLRRSLVLFLPFGRMF